MKKESFSHKINRFLTVGKLKKRGMQGQKCTICKWRIIKSTMSLTCPACKGSYTTATSIKERLASMRDAQK